MEFKIKTDKELESLNTKNLLAYYKAERKRFFRWRHSQLSDHGAYSWELYKEDKHQEEKMIEWEKYLKKIKTILSKREHVKEKNKFNEQKS